MTQSYLTAFIAALAISAIVTPIVRRLALTAGAVDQPSDRKIHKHPLPRVGGVAIVLAFVAVMLWFVPLSRPFVALLASLLVLFGIGLVDDLRGLKPWQKLLGQIFAACLALAGGLGIVYFSNPFGGVIALDGWRIPIQLGFLSFNILPIANLVSIVWIVGMINTVNFLDGLDGLAAGVSSIACVVLFTTALAPFIGNPIVALLSIILLGALLGFLPYNFFPSSIFMGDSGAYVIGLLLSLLTIYSSAKVAVGALVMGIAVLDALWTVMRRMMRSQSPFKADREHLHHRLLDSGLLSHRQVVLLLYLLTLLVAAAILLGSPLLAAAFIIIAVMATIIVLRLKAPQSVK